MKFSEIFSLLTKLTLHSLEEIIKILSKDPVFCLNFGLVAFTIILCSIFKTQIILPKTEEQTPNPLDNKSVSFPKIQELSCEANDK
jgi:hypothetical protein